VLFAALREAFLRAAATGDVVMTVTLSNACPVGDFSSMRAEPWAWFRLARPQEV
jgi:hypothetical protein